MSSYDFSTLSPLDFEILTCDLLNVYFNSLYNFQTFKSGQDLGIDILLSSPTNDYEIIGQVKHYIKSPVSKLIYDLKKTEKDKVFALKPKQYLIVTSLELSPQNKIEIRNIFKPYIKSIDNIFGREDLNKIIRNNRDIEEKHYKLWFSSTIILNKLLTYKFEGRRKEFTDNILKKKLRLFVITNDFFKAKSTLQQNKFLILTGEPGVGKSTLSDMLIYNYIKDDFELNIIYDDIKDIELKLNDNDSKQLFYFDDFLGHTQEEIHKSKSAENALIRIVSRIENLENKYLILNTRKFILTSFLQSSERLRSFNPLRSEAKIELASYSYSVKRRMLDNHIIESKLNLNQKKVINGLAYKICSHENFTPRLIEFFTSAEIINLTVDDFEKFILENLKNPKRIWNHAYSYQISKYDQLLLNTLYSLKGQGTIKSLRLAYEKRLNFEVRNNNYTKPLNSFDESLRRLNDGFIIVSDGYLPKYVSFINHSLEDYLKYSIENNIIEIERILIGSAFIEQWYHLFKPFLNKKSDLAENTLNYLLDNYTSYIQVGNENNSIYKIIIFIYYFSKSNKNNLLIELILKIKSWQFLRNNLETHFYSKKFIINSISNTLLNKEITNTDLSLFYISILNEDNFEDIIEFYKLLLKHYELDLSLLSFQYNNYFSKLKIHIKKSFEKEVEQKYKFLLEENTEKDVHINIIERIDNGYSFIKTKIDNKYVFNFLFIKNQDWNQISQNNLVDTLSIPIETKRLKMKEFDLLDFHNDYDYHEKLDFTLDDLIKKNNLKLKNRFNYSFNKEGLDDLPF